MGFIPLAAPCPVVVLVDVCDLKGLATGASPIHLEPPGLSLVATIRADEMRLVEVKIGEVEPTRVNGIRPAYCDRLPVSLSNRLFYCNEHPKFESAVYLHLEFDDSLSPSPEIMRLVAYHFDESRPQLMGWILATRVVKSWVIPEPTVNPSQDPRNGENGNYLACIQFELWYFKFM